LARNNVQRPGSRAWFASVEMKPTTTPQCMSFWWEGYCWITQIHIG
jgi:hypothetical protein